MDHQPINFSEKFSKFSEHWSPKVIAEMNDYQFKLVKVKGDFVWHQHDHTDESFIILGGQLRIEFEDGSADLKEGEMIVIPKGIKHKPVADHECKILLVEPRGVLNTGDTKGDLTAEDNVWI